jgi:hypothetical protein
MILLQKAVTNVLTVMPVLFHKLLWNRQCKNFTEVKSAMDDFVGSIITNLHLVCQLLDYGQPEVENYCADEFNLPFSSQYRQLTWSFFVSLAIF